MWESTDHQMWSGIIGAALSGAVMLVVLVVTVIVQSCQNKKLMDHQSEQMTDQLEHQQNQFERQLHASEELLREQMRLEREAFNSREIIRLSAKARRAFMDIELIVSRGKNYDDFGNLRYSLLSLNREIESHVAPSVRQEYRKKSHVYDQVCGLLSSLVNKTGGPLSEHRDGLGTMLGGLIELHQKWVDAYIDDKSDERSQLNKMIEETLLQFQNKDESASME